MNIFPTSILAAEPQTMNSLLLYMISIEECSFQKKKKTLHKKKIEDFTTCTFIGPLAYVSFLASIVFFSYYKYM